MATVTNLEPSPDSYYHRTASIARQLLSPDGLYHLTVSVAGQSLSPDLRHRQSLAEHG
ncbi:MULTISPECIES: hypothetical protein [Halomonas]|uniref:hypothetical protein n=1 Tax=Halomonas TaxID=2745 RepID=UPI001C98A863|nr:MULTISPECIES: hypothetical protein [Halomonas]MBY6208135.1 hypothetical protein [Halomonas sp. DP3Y7-2]MBY6228944.1 hypothetical protein [Halomonas sp. DP3Y7-1]MCA0917072.1 hypothetical protein [Halomonas denitrificans]